MKSSGSSAGARRCTSSLAVISVLLAGAAFFAPLPARGDDREPSRLRERVAVDLVTIPVRVEDSRGNPIAGLAVEDFELREDGKARKITNFSAPPGAQAPDAEGGGARSASGNLSYLVIYVDSQNLSPLRRGLAIDRLKELAAEGAHPPVPVMLLNSGLELEVIQKMTSDWSLIGTALEKLRERPVGGSFDATARKNQLDNLQRTMRRTFECFSSGGCGGGVLTSTMRSTLNEIRLYERGVGQESLSAVDRIAGTCNYVAHLGGRKALIYISDGFPMQPGAELYEDLRLRYRTALSRGVSEEAGVTGGTGTNTIDAMINQSELESMSGNISEALERTAGIANSDGISIYTLRIQPPSSGVSGPEVSGHDETGSPSIQTAGRRDQNMSAPLEYLATNTGGDAVRGDVQTQEVVGRIATDADERYVLGFTSPLSDDGKYHKLSVTVKGRKVKVRHPAGYLGRSPQMIRAETVMTKVSHGLGDNPFDISLKLGPGAKDAKKKPVIKTSVLVPIRSMPLRKVGRAWEGKLRLFVLIVDTAGRTKSAKEFEVPVSIPDDAIEMARGQLFPINFDAPATDGENRFGIGLWDEDYIDGSFTSGVFNYEE